MLQFNFFELSNFIFFFEKKVSNSNFQFKKFINMNIVFFVTNKLIACTLNFRKNHKQRNRTHTRRSSTRCLSPKRHVCSPCRDSSTRSTTGCPETMRDVSSAIRTTFAIMFHQRPPTKLQLSADHAPSRNALHTRHCVASQFLIRVSLQEKQRSAPPIVARRRNELSNLYVSKKDQIRTGNYLYELSSGIEISPWM